MFRFIDSPEPGSPTLTSPRLASIPEAALAVDGVLPA